MNLTRITLLGVLFVPLISSGKGNGDGCGTFPERVKEELFRSRQNLERRQLQQVFRKLSGLAAVEEAKGASRDSGNLVLMEEDAGIISRRNPFNLAAKTVRFVPAAGGYRVEAVAGDYNDAEQTQGTAILDLGDDDSRRLTLPFAFPFYGQNQSVIFVNSDGNLTFEAGDTSTRERSLGRLLSGLPRIAPLFEDLDPSRSGQVKILSRADRVVITWLRVGEYSDFGVGPQNTFQVRLLPSGVIEFAFADIASEVAVAGISPGRLNGASSIVSLSAVSTQAYAGAVAERFTNREELDTVTAAQRFYETHEDAYDYLVFYNALGISAGTGVVAYEVTVRNNRTGYGDAIVDAGAEYGSPRRLQAVLNLGPIAQYPVDPNGIVSSRFTSRDTPVTVLGHEAGHLFLAFASVRDPNNALNRPMLGRSSVHWNFTFNSEASLLEGNRLADRGAGASPRFETVAVTEGYSPLDQYLMGFRAKEDVPPTFYVSGSGISQTFIPPPQVGVRFDGTRRDVSVDDLIAEVGPRIPDHTVSQKKFRFGFVVVVPKGFDVNPALLTQVESYRSNFEQFYFRAAGERASAEATLKQSVRLSLWPASGVLAGQTMTATLQVAKTSTVTRTFALRARSALVEIPSTITIPAGQTSVSFTVRGLQAGVDLIEATPTDSVYEMVEARVQVTSGTGQLTIDVVSGEGQLAGTSFLDKPVVVRLVDRNRLPYPGIRILADAGTGAVEPASVLTDENGEASFRWRPAAAPLNRIILRVEGGPSRVVTALGKPYLQSSTVVNAASFSAGVTPLAIQTIFGANLAGGQLASADLPWPARINDVEVRVNGRPQPLIYVSDSQINFYMADTLGSVTDVPVQVVTALGTSDTVRVNVNSISPGIFPGAILRRGEFLEVYGTGLGNVTQRDGLLWTTLPVEATVNGAPAAVQFSGLAPGFVGLYQVNVRPAAGTTGVLRVKLRTNGVESNEVVAP